MAYGPDGSLQSYIPPFVTLPSGSEELRYTLEEFLSLMANAINDRDIGFYDEVARNCGQSYFTPDNNQVYRTVYRKVIDFGALPNATSKSVAHGITVGTEVKFTRIYGGSTKPGVGGIPLPYSSSTLNDNIELLINSSNVVITTATDYSSYTDTYIVVEYVNS